MTLAQTVNVCEGVRAQCRVVVCPPLIISYLSLLCVCFLFSGLKRTSVFERLGAESKTDTTNSTEVRSVSSDHSLCETSVMFRMWTFGSPPACSVVWTEL